MPFDDLVNGWNMQLNIKDIESIFENRVVDFKIPYVVHVTF